MSLYTVFRECNPEYTKHTKMRMRKRGLSTAFIFVAIKRGDIYLQTAHGNDTFIYVYQSVCVVVSNDMKHVVTVFKRRSQAYTSNRSKMNVPKFGDKCMF